jgi:hypothetical protein
MIVQTQINSRRWYESPTSMIETDYSCAAAAPGQGLQARRRALRLADDIL